MNYKQIANKIANYARCIVGKEEKLTDEQEEFWNILKDEHKPTSYASSFGVYPWASNPYSYFDPALMQQYNQIFNGLNSAQQMQALQNMAQQQQLANSAQQWNAQTFGSYQSWSQQNAGNQNSNGF